MTVSKIKTITPDGKFSTSYGEFYAFNYEFEDGTTVGANHKTEASPFNVGDEAEYEVLKDTQYGKKGKVKKVGSSEFNAGSNYPRNKNKGNNRSFALSYAKDIAVAIIRDGKSISDNDIIATAEKFNDWLEGKSEPVEAKAEVKEEAGLPF